MELGNLQFERVNELVFLLDGCLILASSRELDHFEHLAGVDLVVTVVQEAVEVLGVEFERKVERFQSFHELQCEIPVLLQLLQQLLPDCFVEHIDLSDQRVDSLVAIAPALDEFGLDLGDGDDLMAAQLINVGCFTGLAHELLVEDSSPDEADVDVLLVVLRTDPC